LPDDYEDDLYEQDGYHCRHTVVIVREVNDEEAEVLQHIIDQYNNILTTF
jgi:hypothetical protein